MSARNLRSHLTAGAWALGVYIGGAVAMDHFAEACPQGCTARDYQQAAQGSRDVGPASRHASNGRSLAQDYRTLQVCTRCGSNGGQTPGDIGGNGGFQGGRSSGGD
jgi:hypothetical protein